MNQVKLTFTTIEIDMATFDIVCHHIGEARRRLAQAGVTAVVIQVNISGIGPITPEPENDADWQGRNV